MNKDWFIFKGTHHLGPFSYEEVAAFFHKGEINQQTLIWKEGSEKWEPLKNQHSFANLFVSQKKSHDELPSLPEEDEEPPPIPLDAIIDPQGKFIVPKKPFDLEIETEVEEALLKKKRKRDFSFYLWIIVGIVFLGIVVQYFFSANNSSKTLRIRGLMPSHLEKLQSIASSSSKGFELTLALSLDGKTLWGSTNKSSDLKVVMNLISIDGRVLGNEEVKVVISGKMRNHLGEFTRMVLKKGKSLFPGEYRVDAVVEEANFFNQVYPKLEVVPFFKSLNKKYKYSGTALIYSGTDREFEKRIFEYKNQIISEKLKPFTDKLERVQTVLNLLISTSQNYQMTLEKIKKGSEIDEFERKYIKEISPLLQSLTLRTLEMAKDPKLSEENIIGAIAPYSTQLLIMKQLGELASDMITKTSKFKKIKDKDREMLKNDFEKRANSIKLQLDLNIKKLETEISKVNPGFR